MIDECKVNFQNTMKTQHEKAKKCESGGGYALADQSQWGFVTKMYALNDIRLYTNVND